MGCFLVLLVIMLYHATRLIWCKSSTQSEQVSYVSAKLSSKAGSAAQRSLELRTEFGASAFDEAGGSRREGAGGRVVGGTGGRTGGSKGGFGGGREDKTGLGAGIGRTGVGRADQRSEAGGKLMGGKDGSDHQKGGGSGKVVNFFL